MTILMVVFFVVSVSVSAQAEPTKEEQTQIAEWCFLLPGWDRITIQEFFALSEDERKDRRSASIEELRPIGSKLDVMMKEVRAWQEEENILKATTVARNDFAAGAALVRKGMELNRKWDRMLAGWAPVLERVKKPLSDFCFKIEYK